ncbi:hypothetical protein BKA67DRAFT_541307 [Truncatella angustata]|uniref:Uncharacterized protein n=1 Tax=Truncatella angustata TaxID=152316 RepID=A0A9P8U9I5_9PEZI|nr:uncharacterized protein BKA67DRAFT_541307 [Truncatella angustata]KAH6646339.1 hypothetical protein BKA67DRAFT_541307 [Truncatella angustata]
METFSEKYTYFENKDVNWDLNLENLNDNSGDIADGPMSTELVHDDFDQDHQELMPLLAFTADSSTFFPPPSLSSCSKGPDMLMSRIQNTWHGMLRWTRPSATMIEVSPFQSRYTREQKEKWVVRGAFPALPAAPAPTMEELSSSDRLFKGHQSAPSTRHGFCPHCGTVASSLKYRGHLVLANLTPYHLILPTRGDSCMV